MNNPLTPKQALARLQDYCSRAEMSTGEALDKLRRWGIGRQNAITIVQHLVDDRFIDDERFARAFVRDKSEYSRWGRLKIRQALRLKQVDAEYIDQALEEEIDPERYMRILSELLRAKYRQLPDGEDPYTSSAKLIRFAAGRGFEPSLIMQLIRNGALDPDEDEEDC